ncbi:MAG: MBL fold metallo-hydrolase [Spirochaetia bacterium]
MRIRFLGTGAAEGIPAMGCGCAHCTRAGQEGGRLIRRRSAVLFSLPGYELLLDTPPDIKEQLETWKIREIDGIYLTHEHHDHMAGLEEFIYWPRSVDLFAEPGLYRKLIRENWGKKLPEIVFHIDIHPGMGVLFNRFSIVPFEVRHAVPCFGLELKEDNVRVIHGADSDIRFSNHARAVIAGADMLILNTPFFEAREEQSHLGVQEAIVLKEDLGVKRLVLTHFNHFNRPHDELQGYLSQFEGITAAYDGLSIEI